MKDVIDLGDSTKFNIDDVYYKKFCNQTAKDESRSERVVFTTDWQRFLWAFIIGISEGKRTPLENKTKNPPFGTEVFRNRSKILKLMIGLVLQEMYRNNPDQLKTDFELATEKNENIGKSIRVAIEEYANTGFSIMAYNRPPVYIESIEDIVDDIVGEDGWSRKASPVSD